MKLERDNAMLKILIADDDQIALNGIRILLKKKYDFEIFEAQNGLIALNYLQEHPIDILFTDVDMPILSGIELAQKAQQLYPDIKIIFFSAHSDFTYTQNAIHLNAVSYLLKPIQPKEFYEVMDRTLLLCQKLEKNKVISAKRDMELYLSDLFFHCEMGEEITSTGIPNLVENPDSALQVLFIHSTLPLLTSLRKNFDNILDKISKVPAEFYTISGSYGMVILNLSRSRRLLHNWDTWWSDFKREVHQMNPELLLLAIRTKLIHTSQDMLHEMRGIRRLLLLNNYIQETTLIRTTYENNDTATSFQIDQIMEDIYGIISQQKLHLLSEKLHTLTTTMMFNRSFSSFYTKHLLLNILQQIEKQTPKEFRSYIEEVKTSVLESPNILHSENILQELLQNLEEFHNRQSSCSNRYIRQIQNIILTDCTTNLDLTTLADRVNLSVAYMCNLFKKETGISIGQYIKNVRMDKAKELLLTTNLRLNEIYPQVGYSSITYFCIAFKETFGMTPTQFRKQEITQNHEVNEDA